MSRLVDVQITAFKGNPALMPWVTQDDHGNYIAVVFSLEQANIILSQCPTSIQMLLCVDLPRSDLCTSFEEASRFFNV